MRAERLKKYTFKNEIRGTKKRERERKRENILIRMRAERLKKYTLKKR